MSNEEVRWRTNLRANLLLWPALSPNVKALAKANGQAYDEAALLQHFVADPEDEPAPGGVQGKAPTDTRAVRNTFEVMALAGLIYRTEKAPDTVLLTTLGKTAIAFLSSGDRPRANANNIHLLAERFVVAFSRVIEYRAIWKLMRQSGDYLTNEELNRAMKAISTMADVDGVALLIENARDADDPAIIGPRIYEDDKYADAAKRSGQRRAINPAFLLAGAGGLIISLSDQDGRRTLNPMLVPLIDQVLAENVALTHTGTAMSDVLAISLGSGLSPVLWDE